MKKIFVLIVLAIFATTSFRMAPPPVSSDCSCKGKKLYGKVKVVTSFPDFKVKVTNSFPDLKVKVVESFPDECGKWKFVENFPDFTIQYVEHFQDFSIQFVESFPGVR
ncbi:MAG: hypothetical protein LBN37_02660 [Bacteroidales bacterium]|jgi:hypothetical protein|nr:hypothetical protein [Bacteroidales bacterium]